MRLLNSPWRDQFEAFIAGAKHQLDIIVPYYGAKTIKILFAQCRKGVTKRFILALSERDVRFQSQSVDAIHVILHDRTSAIRYIQNLHAKVLIADRREAILTSSNLTTGGLDRNVEMGVRMNEPEIVVKLQATFDDLWSRAGIVGPKELRHLRNAQQEDRKRDLGRAFGTHINLGAIGSKASGSPEAGLGWILIHTPKGYALDSEFSNPMEELRTLPRSGMLWHWRRGRPLKEGGPYRLLFSWKDKIFGEARARVTHSISDRSNNYNFAFAIDKYRIRKPVPLDDLPLTPGQRNAHRDLIRLNERILSRYDALIAGLDRTGFNKAFDAYWKGLSDDLADGKLIDFHPKRVGPGVGNTRRAFRINPNRIDLKEVKVHGKPRASSCTKAELRRDFWKLWHDRTGDGVAKLHERHGIRNLVEFKHDMFQKFRKLHRVELDGSGTPKDVLQ